MHIQGKKAKQLVFPNFYMTNNFFTHWDCNYLLLTRYFNPHTQTQALLVAAAMCNFAQTITGLFLVKCEVLEISVGSIKNKKKISKLSCTETASQWGKAGVSLAHPSSPKQVNLNALFLHDKYNFHLTNFTFRNPWLENRMDWAWLLEYRARAQREFCSGLHRTRLQQCFLSQELSEAISAAAALAELFWAKKSHQRVLQALLWGFLTSTKLTPHPPGLPTQPYLGVNNEYNNSTICF